MERPLFGGGPVEPLADDLQPGGVAGRQGGGRPVGEFQPLVTLDDAGNGGQDGVGLITTEVPNGVEDAQDFVGVGLGGIHKTGGETLEQDRRGVGAVPGDQRGGKPGGRARPM